MTAQARNPDGPVGAASEAAERVDMRFARNAPTPGPPRPNAASPGFHSTRRCTTRTNGMCPIALPRRVAVAVPAPPPGRRSGAAAMRSPDRVRNHRPPPAPALPRCAEIFCETESFTSREGQQRHVAVLSRQANNKIPDGGLQISYRIGSPPPTNDSEHVAVQAMLGVLFTACTIARKALRSCLWRPCHTPQGADHNDDAGAQQHNTRGHHVVTPQHGRHRGGRSSEISTIAPP